VLDGQVLAFCAVAFVLAITPGPDMALVLRNSLRGGRAAGLRTVAGISVGLIGWGLASAFGVAAVLAASSTVFTALKIAGAIYLVYLGVQTFRALRRNEPLEPAASRPHGSSFRQGLVTNLLNPKLAVFFTTLLPQFISEGDPYVAKALLLAVLFVLIGLAWLVSYTLVVDVVARSRRFRATVEAISGAVLVAFGVRLAVDR
jgi:RhtB (resistance to homoserine/threonine) family protein